MDCTENVCSKDKTIIIIILVFVLVLLIIGIILVSRYGQTQNNCGYISPPTNIKHILTKDNIILTWDGDGEQYNIYIGDTISDNNKVIKSGENKLSLPLATYNSDIYVKISSIDKNGCTSVSSKVLRIVIPKDSKNLGNFTLVSNDKFLVLNRDGTLENESKNSVRYVSNYGKWSYDNGNIRSVFNPDLYLTVSTKGDIVTAKFSNNLKKWTISNTGHICLEEDSTKCLTYGEHSIIPHKVSTTHGNVVHMESLDIHGDLLNTKKVTISPHNINKPEQQWIIDNTYQTSPVKIQDMLTKYVMGYNGIGLVRAYTQLVDNYLESMEWVFDKNGHIHPVCKNYHTLCLGVKDGCVGVDHIDNFDIENKSWIYENKSIFLKIDKNKCLLFPIKSGDPIKLSNVSSYIELI